ncbi:hypothetical protein [Celeribacter arenosi]|uniref:Sulfotransferase family protein n=1 Tax=Celeribacter arenosi TaxID=792649 RepID=A0ABP7JYC4_9RHOB
MLVLHVGPHKTASTYIQQNLHRDRKALEKAGWIYPELGTLGLPAHHDLAHNSGAYLTPESAQHPDLVALGQSTDQNLLFSAEGFCRWRLRKFEWLADALGRDVIDVVYVVRDPIDIFNSYWAEEIKQGYPAGLPERFSEHFNDPMASRILNPMLDLAPLLRSPRVKVHAVPFNTLRDRGIDIYENICKSVLKIEDMEFVSDKPKNTSFPIELTEFLRLLTLMEAGPNKYVGSALRHRFISNTSPKERQQLVELVRVNGKDARREITFEPNLFYKRRLSTMLRTKLAENWTLDIGDDELFKTEQQKYVYYSEFQMMSNEVIKNAAESYFTRVKS